MKEDDKLAKFWEEGEKARQSSGKAYLAIREGGNLPPLEKTRDSSPTQEPAFPGPVNNRVIEVYFVKVSLRECWNALLKQDQQRQSQAGPKDTRTYGVLYSKSLILKLDKSWLYPFPPD